MHFLSWQEHLAVLEEEKVELAQQMDLLIQENHCLMQAKMSLGLEVATYRYSHSIMRQSCRDNDTKTNSRRRFWASETEASHSGTLR